VTLLRSIIAIGVIAVAAIGCAGQQSAARPDYTGELLMEQQTTNRLLREQNALLSQPVTFPRRAVTPLACAAVQSC
jgi:hypothetical protein